MSGPVAYDFEPEYSSQEPDAMTNAVGAEIKIEIGDGHENIRMGAGVNSWCSCGNCCLMATERECLCCQEVQALDFLMDSGSSNILICVIENADFRAVCLNRGVLRATYAGLRSQTHGDDIDALPRELSNRAYRLNAYRNFTCWVYGKLGHGNRKVIPSCVVVQIRKEFPNPNGGYTGFLDSDLTLAAYDASWVLELPEVLN